MENRVRFLYRSIDLRDWDEIKKLLLELHLETHKLRPDVYSPEVELKREDYNDQFFGYGFFEGKKLLGLCWGYLKSNGRPDVVGFVEDFIVHEPYRGRGIGSKLFDEFGRMCRTRGANALELLTTAENKKAIEFYSKQDMGLVSYHLRKEWR